MHHISMLIRKEIKNCNEQIYAIVGCRMMSWLKVIKLLWHRKRGGRNYVVTSSSLFPELSIGSRGSGYLLSTNVTQFQRLSISSAVKVQWDQVINTCLDDRARFSNSSWYWNFGYKFSVPTKESSFKAIYIWHSNRQLTMELSTSKKVDKKPIFSNNNRQIPKLHHKHCRP